MLWLKVNPLIVAQLTLLMPAYMHSIRYWFYTKQLKPALQICRWCISREKGLKYKKKIPWKFFSAYFVLSSTINEKTHYYIWSLFLLVFVWPRNLFRKHSIVALQLLYNQTLYEKVWINPLVPSAHKSLWFAKILIPK